MSRQQVSSLFWWKPPRRAGARRKERWTRFSLGEEIERDSEVIQPYPVDAQSVECDDHTQSPISS